jgi:hypothetical protein
MSDIDHVMKGSTQSAPEASSIEELGDSFNAIPSAPRNDVTDGDSEMPRPTVTAFTAKSAPPAGRRPLFRR